MWQLGFLTFHGYGLLIGLGLVVGWAAVQPQAKYYQLKLKELDTAMIWAVVGGIVGARLYHVVTDWSLYQAQPWEAVFVWQGGLSIIGAVLGGGTALWLAARWQRLSRSLWMWLDLSVFGLPLGQAIGRVGNWWNQELYGLPTSAPWGIYIQPAFRLPGYEAFERFHPLFGYEIIALLGYTAGVWWWSRGHRSSWRLGDGRYFASYLIFYSLIRFSLDFWRIDKAMSGILNLGINQLVMLLVLVVSSSWFLYNNHQRVQGKNVEA